MRQYHIKKINKFLKDQKEANEKAQSNSQMSNKKSLMRPNIKPSATFNFKK